MSDTQKSDVSIAKQVAREIDRDPSLDGCPIQVDMEGGVVVLRGTVESASAREWAEQAARHVPDVRDVANDLVLVPRGAEDRSDAEVARGVRHALESEGGIPHQRIRTSVTGGVVTLTGQLDRWCESRAAESVVAPLSGVRSVVNEMQVAECVSPKDVHDAIVKALTEHALEEANRLDVGAFQGEITVAGEVASSVAKQILLQAVRAVPGVREVRSLVRVRSIGFEPSGDV
jgi:osmotically-inducible protein OsmY